MVLQFIDFKKKISKKTYLEFDFILNTGDSLAIIDSNDNNLDIIKNVLDKKEKYEGEVLLNDINIKDNKKYSSYISEYIGFFPSFSVYQNLKHLFKISGSKKSKSELLNIISDFGFNHKEKFSKLDDSSKNKLQILYSLFATKELFVVDIRNFSKNDEFLKQVLEFAISVEDKTVVVLSNKINNISNICNKVLVIADNKKSYFGDIDKLNVVKDLVIIELSNFNSESIYVDLQIDMKLVGNKLIIHRNNLEDTVYYFVKSGVEITNIKDFNENTNIYDIED